LNFNRSVARLWTSRVSPRRKLKFHGVEFFTGEETSETPLVAAVCCIRSAATDEQKQKQTDKQASKRIDIVA